MGKFKDIKNFFKAVIQFIIKLIKFIPTILGQAVMWLAIIILAVILIYLIAHILSNVIADIMGLDSPGLQETAEHITLQSLTANGYDGVMPADDLQDYYAYEYAVLMDLARNLEEAGTYIPREDDSERPYDPALISVEEWAMLCADTFVVNYPNSKRTQIERGYTAHSAATKSAIQKGIDAAKGTTDKAKIAAAMKKEYDATYEAKLKDFSDAKQPVIEVSISDINAYIDSLVDQALAQTDQAKPSNEMSKEELIYKRVVSSTTDDASLVPYIVVTRPVTIYSYEFVDHSLSMDTGNGTKGYNGEQIDSNGKKVKVDVIFREGKGGGDVTNPDIKFGVPANISGGANPVTGGTNPPSGSTADYIHAYIRPLNYNSALNANNIAFHKNGVPGSSTQLDITGDYSEAIWYGEKDDGTVKYEIPLKTIADRFMPKAVLLSSWYMLKQDEKNDGVSRETVETILAEIKEIYDKACLEGEAVPESNHLLVKDVLTINPQTSAADKKALFTRKDFVTLNAVPQYASFVKEQGGSKRGTDTHLLYERYDTEFDSRKVVEEISRETITTPPTTATPQPSLLEATKQKFDSKNLAHDIIDDFNLVLTHHNDVVPGFMNDNQYDRALADFTKILGNPTDLTPVESISNSDDVEEFIMYKTDADGKYIINCAKLAKDKHFHHNVPSGGSTHEEKYKHEYGTDECDAYMYNEDRASHDDPYTDDKECFIPQIKVSFARVNLNNYTRVRMDGSDRVKEKISVKVTTVTIIDGNVNYLYRVEGIEIEDLAGITNAVSFMKFDRYDASMTNYSDWDEENTLDDVNDRLYFAVTDLFGAAPITDGGKKVSVWNVQNEIYDRYGKKAAGSDFRIKDKKDVTLYNSLEEWYNHGLDYDKILSGALTAYDATIIESGTLAIVRPLDPATGQYDTTPPDNAAPATGQGYNFPPNCPFASNGESKKLTSTYVAIKDNDPTKLQQLKNEIISLINSAVNANIDEHFRNEGYVVYTNDEGTTVEVPKNILKKTKKIDVSIGAPVSLFTVDERITTIKQTVKHREMPVYLPRYAETWSSIKTMKNTFSTTGRFDPDFDDSNGGFMQLVPRSSANQGIRDIFVDVERSWRAKFYAQHFSKVRESDVLAMIAEWENAGNKGHFAAYTYIRDIYSLIQKAKEIKKSNTEKTYIHKDSYKYMYIPDEILYFDESVTDKAFWLERILATKGEDSIQKEEHLMMRNKRSVKTWQIVDYESYDECKGLIAVRDKDGNIIGKKEGVNVYALWPLGGYLGRSLYAFEANSSASGNEKVVRWGSYVGPGVHSGVDLYGRGNALRIYKNAFNANGSAKIKAEYNADGTVTLTDGINSVKIGSKSLSSGTFGEENEGVGIEGAHNEGNISGNSNKGAYMSTTVPINIDGTTINFAGSSSAVYGYELYRLTKAYESGEKAEIKLKEILQTEMSNNPVVAIAPGTVESVKGGARPGFMVKVKHANGITSSYLHMKRWPEVQVGEYIGAGTILGYEGTTGNSGGNHVHHEIHIELPEEGGARYPIARLYPFFTPFYNEKEVKDEDGNYKVNLENDYLSIVRTVFPVGQIVSYSDQPLRFNRAGQDITLNQVERDSDDEIIIKNYVPTKELTTADLLIKEKDVENQTEKLNNRIKKTDKSISDDVTYTGNSVVSLPQYFDQDFMTEVKNNSGHILKKP